MTYKQTLKYLSRCESPATVRAIAKLPISDGLRMAARTLEIGYAILGEQDEPEEREMQIVEEQLSGRL